MQEFSKKKVFQKIFQTLPKQKKGLQNFFSGVFRKKKGLQNFFHVISKKYGLQENLSLSGELQNYNNSKNSAVLEPRTGQFLRT